MDTNDKVYRSSSANGTYSQIESSTTSTSLNDSNPLEGNNYYKVKAFNSAGGSPYSNYVLYEHVNTSSPCPPHITGSATSTKITLHWSFSTDTGCGKPTNIIFKVKNPDSSQWADLETFSGSATSYSFTYPMWADSDGWIMMAVWGENAYGAIYNLIYYNKITNEWGGGK